MELVKGKKYTDKQIGVNLVFDNEYINEDGKKKFVFLSANNVRLEYTEEELKEYIEEFDPTKGIKNTGKLEWHYVPFDALEATVKVLNYGAKKYDKDNWRLVKNREEVYYDACMRHIFKWLAGETEDPETKLSHWAHVACCAWFMYEFEKENIKNGKNKWGK